MTAVTAGPRRGRATHARPVRIVLSFAVLALCAAAIAAAGATTPVGSGPDTLLLGVRLLPLFAAAVVAVMILWAGPVTLFRGYLSIALVAYTGSAVAGDLLRALPSDLAWIGRTAIVVPIFAFLPIAYFFPTGHPVPRWSAWLVAVWAALALFALSLRWDPVPPPAMAVLAVIGPLLVLSVVLSQILRFRRAPGAVERQQLKWVHLALGTLLANMLAVMLFPVGSIPRTPVLAAVFGVTGPLAVTALAVAIGFAMLKYRLLDVDLVIGRAIVSTALVVFVMIVYLVIVGAVGLVWPAGTPLALPVAATAVAALGLSPVRRFARARVNRWLYGRREDPATVLGELAHGLALSPDLDTTLERIGAAVTSALRLQASSVTVSDPQSGSATRQAGEPTDEDPVLFPVVFQGARQGMLSLWPRGGERLSARDLAMVRDVADSAGIAVHAALLSRGLQRSRELLVAAREDERAGLQRDLHDGIGPTLASIGQRIDRARALIAQDPAAAGVILSSARDGVEGALSEVRAIVAGLRPPALVALGLTGAIRAAWDGVSSPAVVITGEPGDLPEAVEIAAYRIVMEAVGNAVSHAAADRCVVELIRRSDDLMIRVRDDGAGGARNVTAGNGLRTMRERAEELGGWFRVASAFPGTVVEARIPLADAA
ncbi:MAG: hypothetical protein JST33_01020 [Actinobacteria bacterium]|nr:hypothetical protein [Actinomycetota bacterium]